MNRQKQKGFIALISAVITGLILVGLTFAASLSGYFLRSNSLNSEYKRISLSLAEACQNASLLKLAQDYDSYAGAERITIDSQSCAIDTITTVDSATHNPVALADRKNHDSLVATITTRACYPPDPADPAKCAGASAFSNVSVNTKVQNPNTKYIIPTTLTLRVNLPPGANPADFPLNINGQAVFNGQPVVSGADITVTPGLSYNVSVGYSGADYEAIAGWANDCHGTAGGGSTNLSSLVAGKAYSCDIAYTVKQTHAYLTLLVNVPTGANVADFPVKIDGLSDINGQAVTINQPIKVTPDQAVPHTVSVSNPDPLQYQQSDWTGSCDAGGTTKPDAPSVGLKAGSYYTCVVNFSHPTLSCADTVMMLDRTGSMGDGELADERAAAKGLLDLYSTVKPKVGIGVFNKNNDSVASAGIVSNLTDDYANLYTAVNNWLAPSFSQGYTNLHSAIGVSQMEFDTNGSFHSGGAPFEHVLILLSDGEVNRPSGTTASDTGFKFSDANAINGLGDAWTHPEGAYGIGDASDNNGHRHQFYNFNLSVPSGAAVNGIEVKADAFSEAVSSLQTIFSDGFGTGSTDSSFNESPSWSEGGAGAEKRAAGSGNDSGSPDGGRFAITFSNDGYICTTVNAVGTNNMQLSYYWRGDSDAEASDLGIIEYATGGTCNYPTGISNIASHQLNASVGSWSLNTVNLPPTIDNKNWLIRIRTNSNANSEHFRVDGVKITGNKQVHCQMGVDFSWDGGNNWSDEKTQLLNASNSSYNLGGNSDKWGYHSWLAGDFSNTNFRLRVHQINPGPVCHLDSIQAKIYYTTAIEPVAAAFEAADLAKSKNTKIFTIRYSTDGNADAKNLLGLLASGDFEPLQVTIPANGIKRSGSSGTVTVTTGIAHNFYVGEPITIAGVANSSFNGSFTVSSIPTATSFTYKQSGTSVTSGGGNAIPAFPHLTGSANDKTNAADENNDGDNFYISPTSADMAGIFEDIGKKVCPAAAAAAQSKMVVGINMIHNYSQTDSAGAFHITITGSAATPNAFDGNGSEVVVNPDTNFDITVDGGPLAKYSSPQYVGCSATGNSVASGQTAHCNIILYDKPPAPTSSPPPPSPTNIDINSWTET